MDLKKIFSIKNMSVVGKVALAFTVPTIIVAGYYIVDRKFIKQAPLFPLNLVKAREKQAADSLGTVKEKLNKLMAENKIHSFGTMMDLGTRKNYIGVLTEKITDDLKSQIPISINRIEVRLIEEPIVVAQKD